MFKYKIVLGDYSTDGHSINESFWINSTLKKDEIKKIYKNATEKIGFSFVDEFDDYAKPYISSDKVKAISEYLGYKPTDLFEEWKGSFSVYDELFINVLLLLLNKSKDELGMAGDIYEEKSECDGVFNDFLTKNYNIGYGLYST